MSAQTQSPVHLDRTTRIGGVRTTHKDPWSGRSWIFDASSDPAQYPSICIDQCATQETGPPASGCDLPQVAPVIEKNNQTGKLEPAMQCLWVNGGVRRTADYYVSHQFKFGAERNGSLPWVGSPMVKNGSAAPAECFGECNSLPNCWAANYFAKNSTCVQFLANQTEGGRWWVWELNPNVTIPSTIVFGDLASELKSGVAAVAAQVSAAPGGIGGVYQGAAVVQLTIVLMMLVMGVML